MTRPSQSLVASNSKQSNFIQLEKLIIELISDDAPLSERLKTYSFSAGFRAAETQKSSYTKIQALTNATAPVIPPDAIIISTDIYYYAVSQAIYIGFKEGSVALSIDSSKTYTAYVNPNCDENTQNQLFAQVFSAALRHNNYFDLHAAGLAPPTKGRGILLIGSSGSGKSTISLKLASYGWRYLSDDAILMRKHDTGIIATPLRRSFFLTAQTLESLQLDKFKYPFVNDKYQVWPTELFPNHQLESLTPSHIVFPAITREPSSKIHPVSQANVMMKLLRHCPWACYDPVSSERHIDLLTHLSKSTQAWELQAGRDILEQPDCAAKLFEKLT